MAAILIGEIFVIVRDYSIDSDRCKPTKLQTLNLSKCIYFQTFKKLLKSTIIYCKFEIYNILIV